MGLDARKPVFGVSDKVGLNPVSSATDTSWKIKILLVASLDMILSNKQITKGLIRLHGCAGWSTTLLFPNHQRQVFSRRGPYVMHANYFTSILSVLKPKTRTCKNVLRSHFFHMYDTSNP